MRIRANANKEDGFMTTDNDVIFAESSRVAGPVLIVLSLVLHITSVTYCIVKRLRRRAEAGAREREDTDSLETARGCDMDVERLETECLLVRSGDIACFPNGSLR